MAILRFLGVSLAASLVLASGAGVAAGTSAVEIEKQLQLLANGRNPWPGFVPLSIPLAIYDGSKTYAFRHPKPGGEFAALNHGVYVMSGRHTAVTSNSSAVIGGVMTATLMADGERGNQSADELAATALHESFHVYQRAKHKTWGGNEGDLLLYPVDDATLLSLRRQETEALRRALATRSKTETACWARVAMDARRQRFAAMDKAFSSYERLTELNEGLATYVQLYALYRKPDFPEDEFEAAAVRHRIYTVGPALAYLLDAFRPDWQQSLEQNDGQFLDEMLSAALPQGGVACEFSTADREQFDTRARADAQAVVSTRQNQRKDFDAYSGFQVVIDVIDKNPLFPEGFDPLNVELVDRGLLHTRYVKLANQHGSMEALDGTNADIRVLTEGPGPHPLFNGVTRAVIHVSAKPEVNIWGEHRVALYAPGFKIRVEKATIKEDGNVVRIQLGR